ncbi:PREDICTED: transcription factor PERIANTHIA isoform X2 [Tarenaya hassleriana]|uniref:transcription factor PERIANTHIA isoform X2 n=1 Tax=Tarenaya hassleriana TaxID=28532 RepID=UPI00053C4850|nr:PREDICTED: transcription factor PERIANTHIA isoform X2 [Tarenaya hassleriana]
MQSSFKATPFSPDFYCQSSFFYRGSGGLEEIHQPTAGFHHDGAVDLSPTPADVTVACTNLHYATFDTVLERFEGEAGCLDTGQLVFQGGTTTGAVAAAAAASVNGHCGNTMENWCDSVSAMADNSQHTDTSTDIDTDDKTQLNGVQQGTLFATASTDQHKAKSGDQKTLRRLAQNREAARKSRLRKKAYVQQLESSRLRLAQLEEELKRARQQGFVVENGVSEDHTLQVSGNGTFAFELEYARWVDEHQRLINDLRSAVNLQMGDNELRVLVDAVMAHYDEIFRLKGIGSKVDVFHMLSGMWTTPAERFFMWLGGFRSSELLRILGNNLDPLTEQQLTGICNLQQSSLQAEEALSQGMEALQQTLLETLSSSSSSNGLNSPANVADYMGQMAIAMGRLASLENFLRQADLLRQQTLQQLYRILTTRQAARAFLVIHDYVSRLRALSSLWLARPKC